MIPEPPPLLPESAFLTEFRPFPPSFRWLQVVRSGPFCVVAVLVAAALGVAVGVSTVAMVGVIVGVVVSGAAALGVWWWSGESTRRRSWLVGPDTVELRMGVWWRTHAVLPRSRVQNVTVATGPVRSLLGLVTVVVHSAGAATPNVVLHGVAPLDGDWVHEVLLGSRRGPSPGPAPGTGGGAPVMHPTPPPPPPWSPPRGAAGPVGP